MFLSFFFISPWEDDSESTAEAKQKDLDKVNWVRDVLHKNKNLQISPQHIVSAKEDRTVSGEV